MKLKRFWFEFNFPNPNIPNWVMLGCGVTAWNYDDALNIIKEKVSIDHSVPSIKKFIEDVDVTTLEKDHVLPNLSALSTPNIRGVWYPIGFD